MITLAQDGIRGMAGKPDATAPSARHDTGAPRQQYPSTILQHGHDFQFEHRPITGGWDTGMWCSKCGSRMNQAPEVCPGRKP